METLICIGALLFLMFVAYRGFSVIIFAPVAAMLAVLLTHPIDVAPVYSGLFMEKMVGFVKLYFPAFLLGAIFGKVIELSGFARSIVAAVIKLVGRERAILSIVIVCAILTYGGVSLFVVVFAVYPFAAEMFRMSAIPKRLIPGTIALGAFTFTMELAARHAADPEYHSNQLLRDGCLGRARTRHRGRSLHPDNGDYLSGMAAQGCDGQGRGLWQRPYLRARSRRCRP